jgi:type IV pilus assembly protein PilC
VDRRGLFKRGGRIPQTQKIFFTQNLEVMIRTGFSLGVALRTLVRQVEHKKFKAVISDLKDQVEGGVPLATALARHPKVFPELFVNMIGAGESSGRLDEVLARLTTQMKKEARLKGKVRGALTYPVIVVVAMIGVGTGMLTFVIPKIAGVYSESGGILPLPTRVLLFISDVLVHQGIWIGLVVVALVFGFIRVLKSPRGKRWFDQLTLRLPIVAPIVQKINIAQITRTLSSLLSTDIPIVTTFQIIAKTLGNQLYRESMVDAAESVKKGVAVVKALEVSPRLYPPVVTQMVAIGEESGTLDSVSAEIANFYEEDVDQTMSNLSTILEPVLMLMIGAGVAGIALAVLLPIYNLSSQIS